MKKTVALLLVLTCSASAADLASVVPEDAFFYAEISDPMGLWADFEQSGLLDIVKAIPGGEMGLRAGCAMLQQKILTDFGVQWTTFLTRYGKQIGIVMVRDPKGQPFPCFLLDASETKNDLRQIIKGVEATLGAKATFATEIYQGARLRVAAMGGQSFAAAFLGDVLALGPTAEVKALVDGRARRPLATNGVFARARKRLAAPKGLLAFVNVKSVLDQALDAPELKPLMDLGLSGLQWVALSSAFEGRGVRDRILLCTGEKKTGVMNLVNWLTPGSTQAAKVLPKTCPSLIALTFGNGPELWGRLVEFLAEGGEVVKLAKLDEGKKQIELHFGVNVDEGLIATLGGEIFLAGNPKYKEPGGLDTWASAMPIVGVRVADRGKLETTIHQVMGAQAMFGQGVERKAATHRGVEVSTLAAPGKADGWAYAFVGDYLIVAPEADLVKQCVDAHASGETLATDGRYQMLHRCLPKQTLLVTYTDMEELALAGMGSAPEVVKKQLRPILS
ncbi:hypothetical protein HQ560_15750, partial [bacterium]|nr:hypothetical protein [bacterium]